MSGRWATSNRKAALPRDWHKLRLQRRDLAGGLCEAEIHDGRCDGIGNECHHANGRDDHRLESLRWLNHYCHGIETQAEAAKARSKSRPELPHPGLL
jgi:5-methylcytosine-specific restriction protein A